MDVCFCLDANVSCLMNVFSSFVQNLKIIKFYVSI